MNGFYVFMFLVEKMLNSMIITHKIIFHLLLSIHSTISCWKEVKWRKVIFCFKIAFFNPMTVWEDHVGNDYANRLGSIYACRNWKSLGVRDILKWQKWAQPNPHPALFPFQYDQKRVKSPQQLKGQRRSRSPLSCWQMYEACT